jgi:phosphoadenosine phosphosulfate reductase
MISANELQALNQEFSEKSTDDILRWAWERFGARASIGTSFQGAGLVMIHCARQQGFDFPVFTLDTGLLFPETLELKARLEAYFGISIESLEPDLSVAEQEDVHGPELWRRTPDLCCTVRKVLPLRDNSPRSTAGSLACVAINP